MKATKQMLNEPTAQVKIDLWITKATLDAITALLDTGLYGPSWDHAAEELLRRAVREAMLRGELDLGAGQ